MPEALVRGCSRTVMVAPRCGVPAAGLLGWLPSRALSVVSGQQKTSRPLGTRGCFQRPAVPPRLVPLFSDAPGSAQWKGVTHSCQIQVNGFKKPATIPATRVTGVVPGLATCALIRRRFTVQLTGPFRPANPDRLPPLPASLGRCVLRRTRPDRCWSLWRPGALRRDETDTSMGSGNPNCQAMRSQLGLGAPRTLALSGARSLRPSW